MTRSYTLKCVICLLAVVCLANHLCAKPIMGQYKGTFFPDAKLKMAATAKVVDEGGGGYRIAIHAKSQDPMLKGAHVEIYAATYGKEVHVSGHAGGYEWHGKGPVKVFILAGQSNMEGQGKIKMDPDDVWIWCLGRKGGLTVGYGSGKERIGPEFQFGHIMGDSLENQVLLIKTAWGGKSLAKDFRPPSSGGEVGPYYTEMLKHIKDVLANLKKNFPDYDGQGYEIAGFGWHQGWNDGCSVAPSNEYEMNLANFIRDIRKELGVKNLPFVIANSGFGGRNQKISRRLKIMEAQAAPAKYKEFKGNVVCVETRDFFRPPELSPGRQGYHWNLNAETYFLIGDGMGQAMKKLCAKKK